MTTAFVLFCAVVSLVSFSLSAAIERRFSRRRIAELVAQVAELERECSRQKVVAVRAVEDRDALEGSNATLMEERVELLRELDRYRADRQRLSVH